MSEPISTFTKDGVTKHAYTRADVVQFKFDGWRQVTDDLPAEPVEETPAEASPAEPSVQGDANGEETQA